VTDTTIKTRTLGSIADEMGGTIRTGPFGSQLHESDYTEEGVPVIMPKDIVDGKVSTATIARIPAFQAERLAYHKVHIGDIVYGRRGDIGRCALITASEAGWLCGTGCLRISLGDKIIDPEFLYYYLRQAEVVKWITNQAIGATFANLNTEILRNVEVSYPSLPIQRKITSILSIWDRAIDLTSRLIAAKYQYKRGLVQQLFTGKKRFKEFAGQSWYLAKAGDIFLPYSKRNNGEEELLSVTQEQGAIPRSMLDTRVVMPSGETESYKLVEPGDFIISLRSFQGGIEYSEYRGLVSPAYTVLKPKLPIINAFYKHLFKSQNFISHLGIAIIGIRDGKQINFEDFAAMQLAYPTLEEQKYIAELLDTCDRELALLNRKLELLKKQKQGLMQQLLTGKVRLKT
jgi:type I restriction enzyme S subunit